MSPSLRLHTSTAYLLRTLSKAIKAETQAISDMNQTIKNDTAVLRADTGVMKQHMTSIEDDTHLMRSDMSSLRINMDTTELRKILEWLSPTDYPAQQSDVIERRQEGTGQWFLDAPELAEWLTQPHATLFCPGIPGAGKTVVSATLIDHLSNMVQSDSVGVAYIYCNYQSKVDQDTCKLLAAILKQLVQARPSLYEPVKRSYAKHAKKGTRPSVNEIFQTLQETMASYKTVYLIVDALDECDDSHGTRRELLTKLNSLQSSQDVRAMITSRPIPEIMATLPKAIRLEIQANREDVEHFVAGQMYRMPRCIRGDSELQAAIKDSITDAARGMYVILEACSMAIAKSLRFLLARLSVDSLLDKRTKSRVKSCLGALQGSSQSLEKVYDKAYDEAIQRIQGQLQEDTALAKRVLGWIINAKRPLTINELCHALAVEPRTTALDPDNIPDIDDLASVSAGLVSVDKESKIVRLVHYTTQEYLERTQESWNPGFQVVVASTCLQRLSFDECWSSANSRRLKGYLSPEEFRRLDLDPFLIYAAQYWGQHVRTFQTELLQASIAFLRDKTASWNAMILRRFSRGYSGLMRTHLYARRAVVRLLAEFGLDIVLAEYLSTFEADAATIISPSNRYGLSAVSVAAEFGHESVIRLFIEQGAKIHGGRESPLAVAACNGQEGAVKLLLLHYDMNHGARKRSPTHEDDLRNALVEASSKGHGNIAELLLNAGAEVNELTLEEACSNNDNHMVGLLLDRGADVNAGGGQALQTASWYCKTDLVKLLLHRGADVNACKGQGETVLLATLETGLMQTYGDSGSRDEIIAFLLEKARKPDTWGGKGRDFQPLAFEDECLEILWILIENGASVICLGGKYGSTLNLLGCYGATKPLRVLHELYNAGPTILDFHGRTALHLTAIGGHFQTFIYLLDIGYDPEATDHKGDTPLVYAALGNSLAILDKILEICPNHTESNEGWNPLQWAFRVGNVETTERLVEKGFRDNSKEVIGHGCRKMGVLEIALFYQHEEFLNSLSSSCKSLLGLDPSIKYDVGSIRYLDFSRRCYGCFQVGEYSLVTRPFSQR